MNIQGLNQAMGFFTGTSGVSGNQPNGIKGGNCAGCGGTPSVTPETGVRQARSRDDNNVDTTPEVDQEKVDRLKQEIENGEYEVNNESIARKILGSLFGRDDNKSSS